MSNRDSETAQACEPEPIAEKDAACCACTKPGIAFVIDGPRHKPVCEQHGRMYRQQGYRITGGPTGGSDA